jgi:hypothetical protein
VALKATRPLKKHEPSGNGPAIVEIHDICDTTAGEPLSASWANARFSPNMANQAPFAATRSILVSE